MRKRIRRGTLEENDVVLALKPFECAERDRRLLRMHREWRDLEAEVGSPCPLRPVWDGGRRREAVQVMKDVPGWKVGTWYGEPKFLTTEDSWWDSTFTELAAHSQAYRDRLYVNIWVPSPSFPLSLAHQQFLRASLRTART